jgi:hypothetical protein
MRRLTLLAAATAALVPATLGLLGNESFAQDVPTRVPAQVQIVSRSVASPTTSASMTDPAGHDAGDDKGGLRPSGASDDPAGHDAGDDKGGLRPSGASDDPAGDDAGDDKGGTSSSGSGSGSSGSGSGSGGHGTDDGSGHH